MVRENDAYSLQGTDTVVEARPVERDMPSTSSAGLIRSASSTDAPDRVRWGPIWSGLVTTVSSFVLLEMLVYALGWVTFSAAAGGITQASNAWVTWIVAMIAFLSGGVVAAITSPLRGRVANTLNGFLVWGLATSLIIGASLIGGGLLFGSLGDTIERVLFLSPGRALGGPDLGGLTDGLRNAASWAFITLVSTAIAAALGGWLGDQRKPVEHVIPNGPISA